MSFALPVVTGWEADRSGRSRGREASLQATGAPNPAILDGNPESNQSFGLLASTPYALSALSQGFTGAAGNSFH
jgi:hypothetical protein